MDFFWKYSWPGNVRELQHIIESAVNQAGENDEIITLEHCRLTNLLGCLTESHPLPDPLINGYPVTDPNLSQSGNLNRPLSQETRSIEKKRIFEALNRNKGNIAAAARDLYISRQLLNYKIRKFDLLSAVEKIRTDARLSI
jgi:arginine utilization regulatory protein